MLGAEPCNRHPIQTELLSRKTKILFLESHPDAGDRSSHHFPSLTYFMALAVKILGQNDIFSTAFMVVAIF
jgi:hypothetical protein